ncbi:dehydration-responsive element-binding protein 1f-like [Trifolium pratense]|uniref:Dehydration-responsive element-binding protein 1f-like n=1 Tax=Trifolium pratense TaxID=57577 RepID=A0A2K3PRE1_TRIPR|nr:dehydration-responsive element-binding protein 1E-like isoform X1 [Trifolium pratense]PNY17858.1 dehydration-responsive element-binding protein 1f-like [Trifolium pratense]
MMKSSSSLDESNYLSYSTSSSEASCSEEFLLASEQPKKKAGRRKFKETRHPVYRGIRRRNNNKWVCEVRVPNDKSTRIWLGTYPTPEMAARAHDVAALALRGKSACLNFADSAWRLTLPVSTDPKEIRKMAAEAALAFAVEDGNTNTEQLVITDCDVTDVNSIGVLEDDDKILQGLCVEVPELEQDKLHDWIRNMADEPLQSPACSFIRSYGRDHWNNVDVDVEEVSLWSFTI